MHFFCYKYIINSLSCNLHPKAFVMYCFFNLLINYLGGDRSLLISLHGRPPLIATGFIRFFVKEIDISDPRVFLFLKRSILQYVYLKPLLAAATVILKWKETYNDGTISTKSGYFWIAMIYNISCTLCLACLVIFYSVLKDDLAPYR